MRKLIASLLTVLVLGTGAAFAQDDAINTISADPDAYGTTQWVGFGVGYPTALFYGLNDVLSDDIDLRFRLSSYFRTIDLGADVLFDIASLENSPLIFYAGGGANISIGFAGGFGVGVSGLVGGEYRLDEHFGIFGEAGLGFTFGFGFTPRGTLGVNYHF